MVGLLENEVGGVFNAGGPAEPQGVGEFIRRVAAGIGSDAEVTWIDDLEFLQEHQFFAVPWIPPEGDLLGMATVNSDKALSQGLTLRPVEDTARDSLDWFRSQPEERQADLRHGPDAEAEAELLAAWKSRTNALTEGGEQGGLHPPERPSAEGAVCRNCARPLEGNYCATCGQSAWNFDVPLVRFVKEFLSESFDLDARLRQTVGPLFLRPGYVAAEYVAGHRARFVPPIRMYILASFVMFLVLSLTAESQVVVRTSGEATETETSALAPETPGSIDVDSGATRSTGPAESMDEDTGQAEEAEPEGGGGGVQAALVPRNGPGSCRSGGFHRSVPQPPGPGNVSATAGVRSAVEGPLA